MMIFTVYPRWRGEHPLLFFHRPYSCGLSPLARGTRPRNICRSAIPRFIPAGAGNTDCRHQVISPKPVYPRWRGEHTVISLPLGDRNGLSPLARGPRNSLRIRQQKYRFIPAGAGNTALLCRSRSVPTVYPRWRGEHGNRSLNSTPASGLSPLARGTLEPVFLSARNFRFIPAGAGNTVRIGFENLYAPVYPRWRGEHTPLPMKVLRIGGLSPLARGTRLCQQYSALGTRFIPAGAGNTRVFLRRWLTLAVYPRWRGEHSKHNLLLINDFLSQSQSTNFIVSHKQHIHYVKEHLTN